MSSVAFAEVMLSPPYSTIASSISRPLASIGMATQILNADPARQLLPGTFEHVRNHLFNHEDDLAEPTTRLLYRDLLVATATAP
jgi:hypothetical protein